MKKINFSKCPIEPYTGQSWTKLVNKQKTFTTMRGYSTDKHKYYLSSLQEEFRVFEEDKFIGNARLIDVEPFIIDHSSSEHWRVIQCDTFSNTTLVWFSKLMFHFYGVDNPALLLLSFEWIVSKDITQY